MTTTMNARWPCVRKDYDVQEIGKMALTGAAALGLVAGGVLVAAPANAYIDLYQNNSYGGLKYAAGHGYKNNLGTFDNRTSSLIVRNGDTATLYQLRDYGGYASVRFGQGTPDLSSWGFPSGGNWDNRTSSVY